MIRSSFLITSINQNSKQSLNPSSNDILTLSSNDIGRRLTSTEISFIKTAYNKHTVCNDYFYRTDYPSMKPSYFSYMINTLSPIFTKCSNFRPPPFKLNRVYFDETLTIKGTGVSVFRLDQQLNTLLLQCRQQPPQFHDIGIHVDSNLYDKLLLTDLKQNHYNKSFSLTIPIDPRYEIKVSVSKSKMFVNVGCTNNAFPFAPEGFGDLQYLLGGMVVYLTIETRTKFFVQPIGDWLITNYHFNKDLEIDIPECRHTINYLREHATIYIHNLKDKKKFLRYEEKRTPHQTINQIREEFK